MYSYVCRKIKRSRRIKRDAQVRLPVEDRGLFSRSSVFVPGVYNERQEMGAVEMFGGWGRRSTKATILDFSARR